MSDCLEMAFTNLLPTSKAIHHFTRRILDHFKSPGATGARKQTKTTSFDVGLTLSNNLQTAQMRAPCKHILHDVERRQVHELCILLASSHGMYMNGWMYVCGNASQSLNRSQDLNNIRALETHKFFTSEGGFYEDCTKTVLQSARRSLEAD